MRATCARPPREMPKSLKTNSFSIISTSDFNKTYENTILSHRRTSKKSARAHLLNLKKPMVFQHSCQLGLRGPRARDWRTYPLRGSLSNNTMRATRARARRVLPPPLWPHWPRNTDTVLICRTVKTLAFFSFDNTFAFLLSFLFAIHWLEVFPLLFVLIRSVEWHR